jgi:HK97 family phage portal protein
MGCDGIDVAQAKGTQSAGRLRTYEMLNKLKSMLTIKSSTTSSIVALHTAGRPQWTPKNYAALAREGFAGNVVGYRAARMVAEAAASVPLLLHIDGKEVDAHPLLALLQRPNTGQTGRDLLETLVAHVMVAGNAYAELVLLDDAPRELYALRPDRVAVVPSRSGWPEAFEYSVGGQSVRLAGDQVLHIKMFHPTDDHYGLSPLEAAARSIDTHNAASNWNKAMLDNAARPSGALVFAGGDGVLTGEQFDRLKAELESTYQGAAHAGRPMILEGGLDWKEMGFSPKDMDFIEAKHMAAREIALAFGVPPMLLGIPGDNTYANYAEANRVFWRQTVVPLVGRVADGLAQLLQRHQPERIRIVPDLDQVEALAPDRDALWKRVNDASFLTDQEKRVAVGYV